MSCASAILPIWTVGPVIVELVAVGTELLIGQIVNSNAATIGSRLAEEGFDVHYQTTVGDNLDRLSDTIRTAAHRADAVILTGGIGPTQDDLTREAICVVTESKMLRDQVHTDRIRERLRQAGRPVTSNVLRMADYPDGSEPLPNRNGVALGVAIKYRGTWIFAVPGVPSEMGAMLDEQVIPRLRRESGETAVLKSRVLRTWGRGEAQVADVLDDLYESANPSIAFLIDASEVRVRITAKADSEAVANEMIRAVEVQVVDRLGDAVFAYDDDTVESIVAALLRDRHWKISTVEAATLGAVAAKLTRTPKGYAVFAGGIVLPNRNETGDVEHRALELLSEAVNGEVVVSVSEIADIDHTAIGGTRPRKVGVAVRTPEGVKTLTVGLVGDDDRARRFGAVGALHAVRLAVSGAWWDAAE